VLGELFGKESKRNAERHVCFSFSYFISEQYAWRSLLV
jgi:hypothetical protein